MLLSLTGIWLRGYLRSRDHSNALEYYRGSGKEQVGKGMEIVEEGRKDSPAGGIQDCLRKWLGGREEDTGLLSTQHHLCI